MKAIFSTLFMGMMLGLATMVTAAELPSYALAVKDGQFTPTKIEVPAGVKFKLAVTNVGRGPEEFESRELNREKVIPAGQSVTILIGPLKVGTYEFFGEYHPSTARGQIVAK